MYKFIAFDFDGTLADSKEVFARAYNQVAEKHRFRKIDADNVEELRKLPIRQRFDFLKIPFYKIPFIAPQFLAAYRAMLPNVTLIHGIRELLESLTAEGYRLAIISSNSEPIIRDFLRTHGIDSIQDIYCSQNIFGKDRVIRKFMNRHGLKPSELLYVGDEQRDIVACHRNTVAVVWVSWGYDRKDSLGPEMPQALVDSPAELLQFLRK